MTRGGSMMAAELPDEGIWSMSKTYLPYDPDQQLLLPAALQEWLPPDHLAYFISDVVDQLDIVGHHGPATKRRRAGLASLPSHDAGVGVFKNRPDYSRASAVLRCGN